MKRKSKPLPEWMQKEVDVTVNAMVVEVKALKEQTKILDHSIKKYTKCKHTKIVAAGAFNVLIDRCAHCGYEWTI